MSSRLALTIATLLVAPAAAQASTVSVNSTPTWSYVHYQDGNEANDVTFTYSTSGSSVTITDPGVTKITVLGDGCVAIDAHTVRCDDPEPGGLGDLGAIVALLDGDDRIRFSGPEEAAYIETNVDGGDGNDVIEGSGGDDFLRGSGGTDVVRGGPGNDHIREGDIAGQFVEDDPTGVDLDALDGGDGYDVLTYDGRSEPVVVDLSGGMGEDVVSGIDWIVGGAGSDTLMGDDADQRIGGRDGDDLIEGRGGDDLIIGGRGDDGFDGGDGNDVIDAFDPLGGRDFFTCGGGNDIVEEPGFGLPLGPDCENGRFFNRPGSGLLRNGTAHPLNPRRITARAAFFRLRCANESSNDFGEYAACAGRFVVREAGGRHRMLAEARFHDDGDSLFVVRAALTPLGRRVLAAGRPVDATAFVSGDVFRDYRWTLQLRP